MTKNTRQNLWLVAAIGASALVSQTKFAGADEWPNATTKEVAGTRNAQMEERIAGRLEEQSRFTLSLRQEPLASVMALLENATAVRFRCGTLPDALISVNAQDAPLLATIEPLFQDMGFAMRREGLNLFVFSNRTAGSTENNPNLPVSWSVWQGQGAPPAGWMNARAISDNSLKGHVTAESLINGTPLSIGWNAPNNDNFKNSAWKNAALTLDTARQAGICVAGPQNDKDAPVWMRWPLNLREVPTGAQLLIETPCDATLFVNGAPLLTNRHGSTLVNLDRVLQRGTNCLALYWPRVPQKLQRESQDDSQSVPLLRYEWFVAGKMNAPSVASLAPPLYETPSVSQPLLNRPDNGRRPGDAGATIAEGKRR